MYIIAGLPLDTQLDQASLLSSIRKRLPQSEIIDVPMFPVQHLDSLLESGDILQEIDQNLAQIIKNFFSYTKGDVKINTQSVDFAIKTFKWSTTKYEPVCIKVITERIKKDVDNFKDVFTNRVEAYEKAKKLVDQANKALTGSIKEVDIETADHEFLVEHCVIVNKNRITDFEKLLNSCDKVISSSKVILLSEKESYLYKVYGLKSAADEVKKMLIDNGFSCKKCFNKEEYELRKSKNENVIKDSEIVKNNFLIFINTNISEIFSLFMHVKVAKLYVECVLLYGVKSCVYFVCTGKKGKILHKWKEIVSNWKFSKRLSNKDNFDGYLLIKNPTQEEEEEEE